MTHVTRRADLPLIRARAERTIAALATKGDRTWKLTADWKGTIRATNYDQTAGGNGYELDDDGNPIHLTPTERAAINPDPLAQLHDRYRAALALLVDACDELDHAIQTATDNGGVAAHHKRTADERANWCISCWRAGGREPRRGARWCRWCEDLVRHLAAEWTWNPDEAPPLELVQAHLDGRRITTAAIDQAMTDARKKRRATEDHTQR